MVMNHLKFKICLSNARVSGQN